MLKLAAALTLAAGLFSVSAVPANARDAANYDGTWSVDLVTESGALCDARYSYTLSVVGGQVRPVAKAATSGASVNGRVGPDGSLGLTVATSSANGTASGRLKTQNGAGTWTVASLCSGRWTARRHTTRTAQAE